LEKTNSDVPKRGSNLSGKPTGAEGKIWAQTPDGENQEKKKSKEKESELRGVSTNKPPYGTEKVNKKKEKRDSWPGGFC